MSLASDNQPFKPMSVVHTTVSISTPIDKPKFLAAKKQLYIRANVKCDNLCVPKTEFHLSPFKCQPLTCLNQLSNQFQYSSSVYTCTHYLKNQFAYSLTLVMFRPCTFLSNILSLYIPFIISIEMSVSVQPVCTFAQ